MLRKESFFDDQTLMFKSVIKEVGKLHYANQEGNEKDTQFRWIIFL